MFKLCNPDILPMRSEHSSKSSLTLNYAAVQHVMLYYYTCNVIL
jgi:hypothetical protein